MRLVNWRALVVGAVGFGLAACGDDVTVTPPPPNITLNPTALTCTTGQTTAVGVTVSGGSNTSVAFTGGTGITVTPSGSSGATVVCGNTPGAGVITVVVTSNGQQFTSSIPVTITAAPGTPTPVIGLTLAPPSATLAPGGSITLTPTITLANNAPANTNTGVTYSVLSADSAYVTVTSNANGTATVTAKTGANLSFPRQVAVTATTVANGAAGATSQLRATSVITITAATLVQSLTVGANSLALQVGQTSTVGAVVTLAPGAPATTPTSVTCTSSTTSVATVSGGGTTSSAGPCVITAAGAGTAVITVRAAADTNIRQQISVQVGAAQAVRLTIQSVERIDAAGNRVAADQSNVFGNLLLTLNLDPGDNRPDSVVVTLGNQRVNCQSFSAQFVQALRLSLLSGAADVQPIPCQVNTAQFNTTTGAPLVLNGDQTLSATVYYRAGAAGTAGTTQTATIPLKLTVNNTSGFFVNVTNTPTADQAAVNASGQAVGPQSVTWRAGSITVNVLPVFFTPQPGGSAGGAQTVQVALVDNSGTIATGTASFTPGAATGNAGAVTFAGKTAAYTAHPANNTLDGYTSPNAGQVGGGTRISINNNANTTFLSATGAQIAQPNVIYVDNAYPEPLAQFVGPDFLLGGTGTSGFLNGNFNFPSFVAQGDPQTLLGDNNGVDRVTRAFFFAPASSVTNVNDIIAANQTATNANGSLAIPANTTPGFYVAAARLSDALGNSVPVQITATNATGTQTFGNFTFGVSTAAPTLTAGGSAANNGRYNFATGTARTVTGTVTSPVGFGRNPLLISVRRVDATGAYCAVRENNADVVSNEATNQSDVVIGASTATTAATCAPVSAGSFSVDPTNGQQGVFTVTVQARDVAGNVSAPVTRTFVVDRVPPVVTNAFAVATAPLRGGQPATFQATATDNLALDRSLAVVNYTSDINLGYTGSTLGNVFTAPFTRSATVSVTIPNLIRGLAVQPSVTGSNNNTFAPINQVGVGATDAGNNAAYGLVTNVASLLDQTQTAPTFFGGTGMQSIDLLYTPSTTTTAAAAAPITLRSATSGAPTSVTITLRQNGVANTPFTQPFQRVELYQRSAVPGAAANQYTLIGTLSQGGLTVTPTSSTVLSTFTVTPGANGIPAFPSSTGTSTVDLLVVATDANGYAVAIAAPTITLQNP